MAENRDLDLTRYVILDDGRLTPEDGSPVRLLPVPVYLAADVDAKIARLREAWQMIKIEGEAEVARLTRDSEILRRCGIVEIAVANDTGSVSEYMEHWEGRAIKAEERVEELSKALAESPRFPIGNWTKAEADGWFTRYARWKTQAVSLVAEGEAKYVPEV